MSDNNFKIEAKTVTRYIVGDVEFKTLKDAQNHIKEWTIRNYFRNSPVDSERNEAAFLTRVIIANWDNLSAIMSNSFTEKHSTISVEDKRNINV
jgi:hypothetical protein